MSDVGTPVSLGAAEAAMADAITQSFNESPPDIAAPAPAETPAPVEAQPEQTAQPQQEGVTHPQENQTEGNKPEDAVSVLPNLPDTPEVRKALEIYGNDPERAAKGFLETNTRNAQMAAKLREVGIDPKTMQPYPKSVEMPEPDQTPQPINEQEVQGYVKDILGRDSAYGELVNQWQSLEGEKESVVSRLEVIKTEKQEAQIFLKVPAIQQDQFAKDEYQQKLKDLALEEMTLKQQDLYIKSAQRDLNEQARARANAARQSVRSYLQQQAEERYSEARTAAIQAQAEAEWETAFPVAIDIAMKKYQIPSELGQDLVEHAKAFGLAHEGPIQNIHQFVDGVAKRVYGTVDKFHRLRSAQYGQQAVARSAQPVSTAQTVASGNPQSLPLNLADHEAALAAQMAEAFRL